MDVMSSSLHQHPSIQTDTHGLPHVASKLLKYIQMIDMQECLQELMINNKPSKLDAAQPILGRTSCCFLLAKSHLAKSPSHRDRTPLVELQNLPGCLP